jgi:uncharacterized protein (DUF1015 family)
MATIIPFKGIRPAKDKVHLVASRSVDGYSRNELLDKLNGNPFTFLHVINPDFTDGRHTQPGSQQRLAKIKNKFDEFRSNKVLIKDTKVCYYIYQQHKNGNTFTGIIGCGSIDDYLEGIIKIHEQTITEREEKLKEYLEICDFNAEPVLFSYPNDPVIDELTDNITMTEPTNDFTTTDQVRHILWAVSDIPTISDIRERFRQIPAVYIADGHHRSASSALFGITKRKQHPDYKWDDPFNFYLGIFFPETQLKIYDFNRVIHDLNNLDEQQFLRQISLKFNVEEKGTEVFSPTNRHNFSMYLSGKWYSLTAREGIVHDKEPVGSLDAFILTEHILSPILGIHDLKTDKRISFVPGIKGMMELKNRVDKGDAVAFGLFPVSMEQLKLIADTKNIMPPKTTWIEPKMRSGLVIYSLSE